MAKRDVFISWSNEVVISFSALPTVGIKIKANCDTIERWRKARDEWFECEGEIAKAAGLGVLYGGATNGKA